MGTSGIYEGPESLEPSHLGGGIGDVDGFQNEDSGGSETPFADGESADPKSGENQGPEAQLPNDTQELPKTSLSRIRSSFTRYTNSGKTNHLERAVRRYVATAGGIRSAVTRMPSSTKVVSNLARFANRVVTEGVEQALEEFNLQSLADRPAAEVLEALVDKIGPEGGTIEEAVARDAMIETIADFVSKDLDDFSQLSREQLGELIVQVIARSITTKVINEIGTNSLHGSASDADFQRAESTLKDYTLGAAQDAFERKFSLGKAISSQQVDHRVKEIFSNALEILLVMLED